MALRDGVANDMFSASKADNCGLKVRPDSALTHYSAKLEDRHDESVDTIEPKRNCVLADDCGTHL